MTTLYLIRGVPGSGKSDLANTLRWCNAVAVVIEADQHFINEVTGKYNFDASQLGYAHQRCQQRCKEYLRQGFPIAVSNTSTTEKEVEVYRKIAEELGCKFVSIIVENRHGGVNQHNVPEEKVQQMKNRFSVKL